MSHSYKLEYRDRPAGYRTPPPPWDAYESLSPREHGPAATDFDIWSRRAQHTIETGANPSTQTFLDPERWDKDIHKSIGQLKHIPEFTDFLLHNATTTYHPDRSQSALELFATVATSPNLGTGSFLQNFSQPASSTTIANDFSMHNGYAANGDYNLHERPTKRSRSEFVETPIYLQNVTRPVTSHNATVALDTSMEDAELLLSFAKGAIHPRPLEITPHIPVVPFVISDMASDVVDQTTKNGVDSPTIVHAETSSGFGGHPVEPSPLPDVDIKDSEEVAVVQEEEEAPPVPDPAVFPRVTTIPKLQGTLLSSDAITTEVNEVQPNVLPTEIPLETSGATPEQKTRVYKGWPKGKPRGPRQIPYAKRGSRRAAKQNSAFVNASPSVNSSSLDGGVHAASHSDFLGSRSATAGPADVLTQYQIRDEISDYDRHRSHSTSALGVSNIDTLAFQALRRGRSVPPGVSARPISFPKTIATGPHPTSTQAQTTTCASCRSSKNPSNGIHDTWIACTACQAWFHQFCVGFKTEREARDVDKFFCDECVPLHGPTTFVRKSSRAHASVDYAGLNEGKIRTSTDVPDHHYIKQFVEGSIQFLPENFPRMRPELVTSDYFEKSGNFSEPVIIPAWMNPRPSLPAAHVHNPDARSSENLHSHTPRNDDEWFSSDNEYDCVIDDGQDKLDMVIPQGLTVRRVAELYGPDEKVEVIDVKSQEGEDKRWSMRQWADYYEAKGEKPVRNVISLEVSQSKLGRLIRRPKVVRDLDLQDSVWPVEDTAKGVYPKVQFYCLMSVANCYTDFHIDFGGSSVYYHILSGKKTFFFIPPKKQHLKKYEEWCLSANQSSMFLGDETKECYRVDLSDGDTMLIPSGWIHAVWTPVDTLVIGGNFLTRMHYGMQIQINEIEKNTGVARKFRYPYFQKVLWCAVIRYLERDPMPLSVAQLLLEGQRFERDIPIYHEFDSDENSSETNPEIYNARYYSQGEVEGWQDLLGYIFRTVMITLGKVQGVTKTTQEAVLRSMPKGYADHLEMAQTFAMWTAWKRGNEDLPSWAYPDAVITEEESAAGEKKMSAAALKRLERQAAHEAFVAASGRRSSARQAPKESAGNASPLKTIDLGDGGEPAVLGKTPASGKTKQNNSVRLVACDSCRHRRRRCRHKDSDTDHPDVAQRFGVKLFAQPTTFMDNVTLDTRGSTTNLKEESASPSRVLSPKRSTAVFVVINTPEAEVRPVLVTDHTSPASRPRAYPGEYATTTAMLGDVSKESDTMFCLGFNDQNQQDVGSCNGLDHDLVGSAKRARTKACDECRKSKRRCIHDENGQVDPIKAQESPIPRGVHGSKRSRSHGDTTKSSSKRARGQSDGTNSSLIEPKVEAGVEYDPHSHLPSPPAGAEFVMDTREDVSQVLYDPTHPPISVDPELLKLEEEFSPSISPPAFCNDPSEEQQELIAFGANTKITPLSESSPRAQTGNQHGNTPQPLFDTGPEQHMGQEMVKTAVPAAEYENLALDACTSFEEDRKEADRQSGTPSLRVQTTSNDSLDASASLPSTPPMSPLTDLGPSSPPHSPGFSFEHENTVKIKVESPPLPRQPPRHQKQVERFSNSIFDPKPATNFQQTPGRIAVSTISPTSVFAKPMSGRKSAGSRSASREIRAASHDIPGIVVANSSKVSNDAEEWEAQDIKLARELSEQDFGLRRRSR